LTTCVTGATKRYVSNPTDLLTTSEVAEQYRVSTMTVRRWVAAGELEAIRLPGRQLRYRRSAVESLAQPADPTDTEGAA
jgi:excisionase family DNA binding protein